MEQAHHLKRYTELQTKIDMHYIIFLVVFLLSLTIVSAQEPEGFGLEVSTGATLNFSHSPIFQNERQLSHLGAFSLNKIAISRYFLDDDKLFAQVYGSHHVGLQAYDTEQPPFMSFNKASSIKYKNWSFGIKLGYRFDITDRLSGMVTGSLAFSPLLNLSGVDTVYTDVLHNTSKVSSVDSARFVRHISNYSNHWKVGLGFRVVYRLTENFYLFSELEMNKGLNRLIISRNTLRSYLPDGSLSENRYDLTVTNFGDRIDWGLGLRYVFRP